MAKHTKSSKLNQDEDAEQVDPIEPWGHLPNESAKAYAAFLAYIQVPAGVRSLNRAYRILTKADPNDASIKAPQTWHEWSSKYQWVARGLAYDQHIAGINLDKWERRKQEARERDWAQAEALRKIVDEALPTADRFYIEYVENRPGIPEVRAPDGTLIRAGVPAQTIRTVKFNVTGLASAMQVASKIQRLTVNEPTDNINTLTGVALDDALERAIRQYALENLPDSPQAGDVESHPQPTTQGYESGTDPDD